MLKPQENVSRICIYTATTACGRWPNHLRRSKSQNGGCLEGQRSAHRLTYGQPFAKFRFVKQCAQALQLVKRANG